MKTFIADSLKRIARRWIKLANQIDGPTVKVYDSSWNRIKGDLNNVTLEQAGPQR